MWRTSGKEWSCIDYAVDFVDSQHLKISEERKDMR
jgi:hypothetical protein